MSDDTIRADADRARMKQLDADNHQLRRQLRAIREHAETALFNGTNADPDTILDIVEGKSAS